MAQKIPDNWDESQPHPDPRRERFAKAVAMGSTYAAAFAQQMTKSTNKDTHKAQGFKVAREAAVSARVKYWRLEHASRLEIPDELDGVMLRQLMEESVHALNQAYEVAENTGACSPFELTKISQLVTRIVGRMSRATDSDKSAPTDKVDIDFSCIQYCECPPDDGAESGVLVDGPNRPDGPRFGGASAPMHPAPSATDALEFV